MSKQDCRIRMKEKLSSLDEVAINNLSIKLSGNLSRFLEDQYAISKKFCIGAFAPIKQEPLWYLALNATELKLTAYPAFEYGKNQMTFRLSQMSELIAKTDFGLSILGPKDFCPEVMPDLILVPGLAFGQKGQRLGRGKGFYDKYLSQYRGIKVGVCFSLQLEQEIPTEEHDEFLDYIITEDKIINCKLAFNK